MTGASAAVDDPILAVDPGTHTGPIRRLAVDSSQATLLTASDDKSARLWDVSSGRLLATLRPPAGKDQIGRLYGAAISPDGVIAVAGTTAAKGGKHRIFLYDLQSRNFLRAIDARGGDVKRLAWLAGGQWLAAAYAGDAALRIFDRQGSLLFEERFSGDSYYLNASSDGRLAVSASDGMIHFYRGVAQAAAPVALTVGSRIVPDGTMPTALGDPRAIQFSPDGKLLVVGYLSRESARDVRVDVYDVEQRTLVKSFSFSDLPQGNLMNVAWQADGRAIYAAGTAYRGHNEFILKRVSWPEGQVATQPIATNSVLDLAPLSDGRIVYSTTEPRWGVIEGLRVNPLSPAPAVEFYESSALKLNGDATEVSWPRTPGASPVRFSVNLRQVLAGRGAAVRDVEHSTWRLRVADWENSFKPTVGGQAVSLQPTEVSRASAVLPDSAGVVLGSSRSLRKFDGRGSSVWTLLLNAEVRTLGLSADGKLIVCGMADGTIRWRRTEDGTLLLSLFVTGDGRWVLWTEQGYFDAGAGAEHLVGWLVNRAEGDQADYFELSRFRDRYYRPDVIDHILPLQDVIRAVATANAARIEQAKLADAATQSRVEQLTALPTVLPKLPPALTLVSPARIEGSQTEINIQYKVMAPADSPVSALELRFDGRPIEIAQQEWPRSQRGDAVGELKAILPARDGLLQLFAINANGTSPPAPIEFHWKAKIEPPAAAPDKRPRLFMVAVGVSKYADKNFDLVFAAKDAGDFVKTFLRQNGRFYRQVDAQLLVDRNATRKQIATGLQWLKDVTTSDDVGILYIAGHGVNSVDDTYYFLPHDYDPRRMSESAVPESMFRDALSNMKGRSLFFVDTCYAGKSVGLFSNQDLTRIANKFSSSEHGVIVFSASNGKQESMESLEWGNGAFTKALVTGLEGGADFRKEGLVTHRGLDYYVGGMVHKLTDGTQTPVTTVPVGLSDFGLSKVLSNEARER